VTTPDEGETMADPITEHLDVLHLQERLDALMRVWGIDNGDCTFDVLYDGCSDHPWTVKVTTNIGSEVDDLPDRIVEDYQQIRYSGATLGAAVEAAWRWHRAPVICGVCKGSGDVTAKSWEIEAAENAGKVLCVVVSHDASRNRIETPTVACFQCNSDGIVWTGPKQ
jgi:hypothetical protein